jgi:hypothetical protein
LIASTQQQLATARAANRGRDTRTRSGGGMKAGVLFNPHALWIGAHYSSYNKRVCINLVPFVTVWVCARDGIVPVKK